MPPRIQREDTATCVVGQVVTFVEYIPRVFSMLGGGATWLFDITMSALYRVARGSAEAVGISFMCVCATMLFVIYYESMTPRPKSILGLSVHTDSLHTDSCCLFFL